MWWDCHQNNHIVDDVNGREMMRQRDSDRQTDRQTQRRVPVSTASACEVPSEPSQGTNQHTDIRSSCLLDILISKICANNLTKMIGLIQDMNPGWYTGDCWGTARTHNWTCFNAIDVLLLSRCAGKLFYPKQSESKFGSRSPNLIYCHYLKPYHF